MKNQKTKGEMNLQNRKYLAGLLSMIVFLVMMAGCSSNNPLLNDDGKKVSLGNKDVPTLVFFFTGNTWDYCKSQLVELQKNKNLFADFPGDVYALSASPPKDNKGLKKELGLNFTILSDQNFTLIEKAKLKDPSEPKAVRGFAILDKEGNVIESQEFDPFGEQASEIISYAAKKVSK